MPQDNNDIHISISQNPVITNNDSPMFHEISEYIKDNFKVLTGFYGCKNTKSKEFISFIKTIEDTSSIQYKYDGEDLFIEITRFIDEKRFTYVLSFSNHHFYSDVYLKDKELLNNITFLREIKTIDEHMHKLLNHFHFKINYHYSEYKYSDIDYSLKLLDDLSNVTNHKLVRIDNERWNIIDLDLNELLYNPMKSHAISTIIRDQIINTILWYGDYFPLKIEEGVVKSKEYARFKSSLNIILKTCHKYLSGHDLYIVTSYIHSLDKELNRKYRNYMMNINREFICNRTNLVIEASR